MDYDDYSDYGIPRRPPPPPVDRSDSPPNTLIDRGGAAAIDRDSKSVESKTDDALKALRNTSAISRDETAGNNLERQRLNVIDEDVSAASKGATDSRRNDDREPSVISRDYDRDVDRIPAPTRPRPAAYSSADDVMSYRDPYFDSYPSYRDPYLGRVTPPERDLSRRETDPFAPQRRDPYAGTIDPYDDLYPYGGSRASRNPFSRDPYRDPYLDPYRDPYRSSSYRDPYSVSDPALPSVSRSKTYTYDDAKFSKVPTYRYPDGSTSRSGASGTRPFDPFGPPFDPIFDEIPSTGQPADEKETGDNTKLRPEEQKNGVKRNAQILEDIPEMSVISDADRMDDLMRRIEHLQQENERLKQTAHKPFPDRPLLETFKTFYCIDRQFYLDEPQWELGDGEPVLRATNAISQIDYYLHQHPEILFLFRKTYQPRPPSNRAEIETKDGLFRKPVPFDERLELNSNRAKDAVEVLAEMIPDFYKLFPRFSVKAPIKAPYLFMYHSEPFMEKILPEVAPEYRRVLSLLRKSIYHSYGAEYAAAKEQAKNGRVSRSLFKYLIRPGDILVNPSGMETAGYEAIDWPEEHKFETVRQGPAKLPLLEELLKAATGENLEGKHEEFDNSETAMPPGVEAASYKYKSIWTVRVVYWTFDGNLAETVDYAAIEILTSTKEEFVSIADLNIYPLEYATTELRDRLQKRGEMFWRFRLRRFVSYSNTEENLDTVSTRFHSGAIANPSDSLIIGI